VAGNAERMHERTLEMAGRERRKRIKEKESKVDDYKTWVYDPAFEVRWLGMRNDARERTPQTRWAREERVLSFV